MVSRKEERKKKNIQGVNIVLRDGDQSYAATLCDLSKTGMSVKTAHVIPTYKMVDVLVKIENKVIPIKCSIRWVHEYEKENEIGLSLHSPPPEYLEHFS